MKKLLFLLLLPVLLIPVYAQEESEENEIPVWVKAIFGYYVEGLIDDTELIEAIEFLIESEIIVIEGYGKIINIEEPIDPQPMTLTVNTDQETYQQGDTIEISGTVPNNNSDTVTIMMVTPDNLILTIQQVSSTLDGTYYDDIKTENIVEYGEYTINIQYDGEKIKKKITIN